MSSVALVDKRDASQASLDDRVQLVIDLQLETNAAIKELAKKLEVLQVMEAMMHKIIDMVSALLLSLFACNPRDSAKIEDTQKDIITVPTGPHPPSPIELDP